MANPLPTSREGKQQEEGGKIASTGRKRSTDGKDYVEEG